MWSCTSLVVAILMIAPASARSEESSEWLAQVDGVSIAAKTVDTALGVRLSELEEEIFKLRRGELDRQIDEKLLQQEASRQQLSVDELIRLQITTKADLVTEAELDAAYQANRSRFVGSESMIRDKLRGILQDRKIEDRKKLYLGSLRSRAAIVDRLMPPLSTRFAISGDGFPAQGPVDAPVTIVEFSDFHCPYCKRVQETLKTIRSQYGNKVRLVYRHSPIRGLHPQAFRAAEAALCASDEGKFWEYHDVLFAEAPKASDDDLKRFAKELVLDDEKFSRCLFASNHQDSVQRDIDEGQKLGITGTPAFFINGRFVNGAQPLEKFVQIIDEELAFAQKKASAAPR